MAEWNQCFYCGIKLKPSRITYDHIYPKSWGGDMMVVACFTCNNLKADMTIDEFRTLLGVELFYGEKQQWKPW